MYKSLIGKKIIYVKKTELCCLKIVGIDEERRNFVVTENGFYAHYKPISFDELSNIFFEEEEIKEWEEKILKKNEKMYFLNKIFEKEISLLSRYEECQKQIDLLEKYSYGKEQVSMYKKGLKRIRKMLYRNGYEKNDIENLFSLKGEDLKKFRNAKYINKSTKENVCKAIEYISK